MHLRAQLRRRQGPRAARDRTPLRAGPPARTRGRTRHRRLRQCRPVRPLAGGRRHRGVRRCVWRVWLRDEQRPLVVGTRAVLGAVGTDRVRDHRDLRLDPQRQHHLRRLGTGDLRRVHDLRLQPAAPRDSRRRRRHRRQHLPRRLQRFSALAPAVRRRARMSVSERLHMPSLGGATAWLNSGPLNPAELRGHVVLVDFWTLTCINWLRTEPYVRAWSQAYRDDGLIVIGSHTPEFSFEHEIGVVRQATKEREIDYPVAVDNDYEVWSAFDNHYWPALYFIDADGIIRDHHFGEGRYEESERVIQRLLGVEREPVSVEGLGVEAAADWDHLGTPETYLGSWRSERFASRGEPSDRLLLNHWGLAGDWTIGPESVVLERAGGSISFRFHARDAHLVLSGGAREPIPFRLLLDGEAPGESHGLDVDEDGAGLLRDGRLYQLVRVADAVRERTLEVTFLAPGAEAYVFTFG